MGERPKYSYLRNSCRSDASVSWADHMADDMDIGPVEHTVRGDANHNIQVLVRVRPPNSRELDQVSAVLRGGTKSAEPFHVVLTLCNPF